MERYLPTNAIRYIAIGDNVDTINPDGLQFLTFKLSFNDYYAQDISNKIRSVKTRKIEKGEFQGGIPPYGYKKNPNKKNHLIPDLLAMEIVQEIFTMYANKGMSTLKIADNLNERKIVPPCVYLKIPTFMKKKSKNPAGYIWSSSQIAKILRNEVYIGNVVGRKFQKISHKVDKVRSTRKEERIIVENMHEPIVDDLLWTKVQDRLNKHQCVKTRINEHPLKEFIYCAECGGKAIYRVRKEKRKSGFIWEQHTFICSHKNMRNGNCQCKPIAEELLTEAIKNILKSEIRKITYVDDELLTIYNHAKLKVDARGSILKEKINRLQESLKNKNLEMEEVYQDKLQKIITVDDFNKFYKKMKREKGDIEEEIRKLDAEIIESEKVDIKMDYLQIRKLANEILMAENLNAEFYSNLIEKVEFDRNKNIIATLTFGEMDINGQEIMKHPV